MLLQGSLRFNEAMKKILIAAIITLILLNTSLLIYVLSIYSWNNTVVTITDEGFVPSSIRIPIGATITWINKDRRPSWPASDFHPTHGKYPSKKKGCISSLLDACRGIDNNEQYSFTFDKKGTWGIHDHLYPGMTMTIEVVDNILSAKVSAILDIFLNKDSFDLPPLDDFRNLDYQKQLAIIKKASSENPKKTWEYLKTIYLKDNQVIATDTSWPDNPHVFAHIVGNGLYNQYGIEAVLVCDLFFAYGCLHGVVERSILQQGIDGINECINMVGDGRLCAHGLGHGLLSREKYDIRSAIKGCNLVYGKLEDHDRRSSCFDGIMMEYTLYSPRDNLDPDNPFKFCDSFSDEFRSSCFNYQHKIFIQIFGWSFDRATKECMNALDANIRDICIRSIGISVAHLTKGKLEKIRDYCVSIKDKSVEYACFLSAAVEVMHQRYYDWRNTAADICSELTIDKERCRLQFGL